MGQELNVIVVVAQISINRFPIVLIYFLSIETVVIR